MICLYIVDLRRIKMNIIDSSKVNKLEEELELTKIQLEQAFKERAAEERIHAQDAPIRPC